MRQYVRLIVFLLAFFAAFRLHARVEYTASFSFENLNYIANRETHPVNDQENLEANFRFIYDNEKHLKLDIEPRVRADFMDSSRGRYIPNTSSVMIYYPSFEFLAGLKVLSFGVSTSFNPTDVINRRDFEDNYYDPEKLGELVLRAVKTFDRAGAFRELSFSLLILPLFQEAPLPENDSRFTLAKSAGPLPYTLSDKQEKPAYPKAVGGAFMVNTTLPPVDFSILYYHGPDRDPAFVLKIDDNGALRLGAFYYTIDMAGANMEVPAGDFVFHLESAYVDTQSNAARAHALPFEDNNAVPESYFQFVPGADYAPDTGSGNLTLHVEYLGEAERKSGLRNFRAFQNDLFFGAKYHFNNRMDTRFSAGMVKDLSNREIIVLAEASGKIYRELQLKIRGIFVHRSSGNTPLSYFDNNSFVSSALSWSFGLGRNKSATQAR